MDNEGIKSHLTRGETWLRGLYMVLFALIYTVAEIVVAAVVVFQFVARLITGGVNDRLLSFGQQLSTYLYQILLFETFNSEERPYPFSPWPATKAQAAKASAGAKRATPKAATKRRSSKPATKGTGSGGASGSGGKAQG